MIGWKRALASVADLLCVVAFAIIGRASHAEALDPGGVMTTLAPFWVGFLLGWGIITAQYRSGFEVSDGVIVAAVTVSAGMTLRALLGGGVQLAFVLVASVFLLTALVAWRLGWRRLEPMIQERLDRH